MSTLPAPLRALVPLFLIGSALAADAPGPGSAESIAAAMIRARAQDSRPAVARYLEQLAAGVEGGRISLAQALQVAELARVLATEPPAGSRPPPRPPADAGAPLGDLLDSHAPRAPAALVPLSPAPPVAAQPPHPRPPMPPPPDAPATAARAAPAGALRSTGPTGDLPPVPAAASTAPAAVPTPPTLAGQEAPAAGPAATGNPVIGAGAAPPAVAVPVPVTGAGAPAPTTAITTTVLAINRNPSGRPAIIAISAGKKAGVTPGMRFTIRRNQATVVIAEVTRVASDKVSYCQLLPGTWSDGRGEISEGDEAVSIP